MSTGMIIKWTDNLLQHCILEQRCPATYHHRGQQHAPAQHSQNLINFPSLDELGFWYSYMFLSWYNTYISTWMQFVFPLYIWLLILTIVLASRYSSMISKIATSNTVSVLATLLLLSYAILLKTCTEAFSFVQLQLLNGT